MKYHVLLSFSGPGVRGEKGQTLDLTAAEAKALGGLVEPVAPPKKAPKKKTAKA